MQRDALDRATDIPSYVALLATSGWANTASVNVVDIKNQAMVGESAHWSTG